MYPSAKEIFYAPKDEGCMIYRIDLYAKEGAGHLQIFSILRSGLKEGELKAHLSGKTLLSMSVGVLCKDLQRRSHLGEIIDVQLNIHFAGTNWISSALVVKCLGHSGKQY